MADVFVPNSPDIDITKYMESFGYYPTEAEAQSLVGSFTNDNNAASKAAGISAVAQYVNQKLAEQERQKNDPLVALQQKMQESSDLMKKQVTGLYGQLQDTLSAAPKLFGDMNPDQIQTYLAPLQTAFKDQLATVQGTIASRGLAASSTENNALAQTGQRFQENTLAAGLDVGMKSQQAKAQAIQDQIKSLLGLTGQEEGIAGAAAGQRSSQDLGQSNLIASLPFFLQQAATQNELIRKQLDSGGGFMDTFNKVTSGINQGMNAFQTLAMIPSQFKTGSPGTPGGGTPYASPSTFQAPAYNPGQSMMPDQSLSLIQKAPALFAAPV